MARANLGGQAARPFPRVFFVKCEEDTGKGSMLRLGNLDHAGYELLPVNVESGSGEGDAGDLQFRSRSAQFTSEEFTQRLESAGILLSMDGRGRDAGQRFHRAVMAIREIRRGLLERLRRWSAGRDCKFK